MDELLIKVFESEGIEKTWLQEKLEDENIPHNIVLEEYWTGVKSPEYHVKQCIYVDIRHEKPVRDFIEEYNSTDFSIRDDDELYNDFENVLPQIICASCGEKIDMDYIKCPFCKHDI